MAGADRESGVAGASASTLPGRNHSAVRVAPLDAEQLRRVLEQVTRSRPRPPVLRDATQQATPPRGPGAEARRLLLPQQLEAICLKVASGSTKSKERPMPPLATIQCKTAGQSQPSGRSVSSPQLLRGQALGRTGSQLCLLRGSPQPSARVFVQKPLPTLQPVPSKRVKAQQTANGCGFPPSPLAASSPCSGASVSSSSARLLISSLHTAHTKKLRKSLKVKTRSGRISRPPKYKARDYKFIKTEDLADGHLSDSDDYSELSVEEEEEEEEQREKPVFFDIEGCALRPRAFKCQTCEKSYIGKGGLARHLKLNPGHGQLEPEMLSKKASGSLTLRCADSKARGLASPKLCTPAALCMEETESAWHTRQNGQPVEAEETLVPEQENSPSALLRPENNLEPKNGNWESQAEPSTAKLQESRAVQLSSRPAVPSGRAQLREALKQCGQEELMELVLPQLAQVVTLCELLLVKVEKSPGAKPFFPAVYKEFEELYGVVKRMCQHHLRSSGPCSQEPLEIKSDEVARSLGITEFLRKKETHLSSAAKCSSQETEGTLGEASGQKREHELGALATVKKPRTAALPTDVLQCPPATSRCHMRPRPSCAPATSKGSAPAAIENFSDCPEGICVEMVPASDRSVPLSGLQLAVMTSHDFEARSGSADSAFLCQDVSRSALYSQVAGPRGLPPAQELVFSEENDHDSGTIRRSNSGCGTPSSGGIGSLLLGESGNAEAGDCRETSQFYLSGQQASPSHVLLAETASFPLQNILPVNILPAACASKIVPEPEPHPGPDGSLSTNGGPSVGSEAGGISQLLSRMETHSQREPETVAAVGETLALEISNVCQEVLSQGQEQIFIQTPSGLIHQSAMMSQEEDSVIVMSAGGSVLRFGPSEGIVLEAMGAFLTVEAESS
ncbi:zinc finger protein 839 [Acomys russatus]|uniref:zinc finger protein 839 n=1 Tax=Acomys russatus TaxID=60746 RepID=UPI0021E1D107|nr:zinc finger protein 839 [Acomys russatus]